MAALSPKLRSVAFNMTRTKTGIAFWCPGCKGSHAIVTVGDHAIGPVWQWDGNVDQPTVSPSILVRANFPPEDGGPEVCHSFLRAGNIQFLGDCTHDLAGQTVPLPDWPTVGDESDFYLKAPHD